MKTSFNQLISKRIKVVAVIQAAHRDHMGIDPVLRGLQAGFEL